MTEERYMYCRHCHRSFNEVERSRDSSCVCKECFNDMHADRQSKYEAKHRAEINERRRERYQARKKIKSSNGED